MYGLQSSEYDKDDKVHNDFKDFKVSREKPAFNAGNQHEDSIIKCICIVYVSYIYRVCIVYVS